MISTGVSSLAVSTMWPEFVVQTTLGFLSDSYMFIAPVCREWHKYMSLLQSTTKSSSVVSLSQHKLVLRSHPKWIHKMAEIAAVYGKVDVLLFAQSKGARFASDLYIIAAKSRQFHVLEALKKLKVVMDHPTIEHVEIILTREGELEELKSFVKLARKKFNVTIERIAAMYGRKEILVWLYDKKHKYAPSSAALYGALEGDQDELFQWLLDTYSIQMDNSIIAAAAHTHDIRKFEMIWSMHPSSKSKEVFTKVMKTPSPQDSITWFLSYGFYPQPDKVYCEALFRQPVSVLDYLHEIPVFREGFRDRSLASAIYSFENGFSEEEIIDKLDWMQEHGYGSVDDFNIYRIMEAAIRSKKVGIISWLFSHHSQLIDIELCKALSYLVDSIAIKKFFQDHHLL